uniref:Uncharacterized protein n=1 Tax=Parascaris univalens TaxID=6257 RepID=A0A915C125_PARUN
MMGTGQTNRLRRSPRPVPKTSFNGATSLTYISWFVWWFDGGSDGGAGPQAWIDGKDAVVTRAYAAKAFGRGCVAVD